MRHPDVGSDVPPVEPVVAREQAEVLHDEIRRLPVAFRLPIVLCYFEGLTVEEAAGQLRWPHGTVRSRLARARAKLRRGLTRRGVALPAAATTVLLSQAASASISSPLCENTTRAAIQFAAGQGGGGAVSSSAITLAREVLRSVLLSTLGSLALAVLFVAAVATGASSFNHAVVMMNGPVKTPAVQTTPIAAKPDGATPEAGAGPHVRGRPRARPVRQSGGKCAGRYYRTVS